MVSPFGVRLRHWRKTRGWSQLQLGLEAGVPQRHVSFLETGRARPKRDMVLRLCEALEVPLSERNGLFEAAGLAAVYRSRPPDGPELQRFHAAVDGMLAAHAPLPALALDGWWDVTHANPTASRLLRGTARSFVESLFAPGPFRARIENWPDVARAAHARLARDARHHPSDARLQTLLERATRHLADARVDRWTGVREEAAVCPVLRLETGSVCLLTMVARFASVSDLGLSDLRVELLYPADASSENRLRRWLAT